MEGGSPVEQLTQMELLQLRELLDAEELAVKKYRAYGQMAQDRHLRSLFEQGATLHQQHLDQLVDQLRALGGRR